MQNFYCDHINLKNVKKRMVGIFHFKKLYCTYVYMQHNHAIKGVHRIGLGVPNPIIGKF